jgi:predicted transcriptional regulator
MDLKTESTDSYADSRNGSQTLILKQIDKSPGIRYRELLRLTGLTNGGLEYHLKILEKSHKVQVDRHDGRRTRYYPLNISVDESHILGCVRNNVARQIVSFILGHDLCTFGEIVEHIRKAPSTVSWHLKRISEAGIISIGYGREYQLYSIVNNNLVKELLHKYKESFRDKIADGYYESFGEL